MSAVTEFRTKTADQLKEELTSLKKESFNLRFQASTGELKNTARRRVVRRDIARIQTVLTEQAKGITVTAKDKPAKAAKPKAAKAETPKKPAKEKAAAKPKTAAPRARKTKEE